MMARGEPMVWISGGALAFCLVMIVGLLVLCLWFGMGTFWPTSIYRVQLVDGSVHMGEVTRYDTYALTRPMAERLSGEIAAAANEAIGEQDEFAARRWLLRTGNYRLTQEHFNWVSDFAMAPLPEGVTQPPWALVLERVEYGHFYGEPGEFAHRTLRTPDEEERELKQLVDFLDSQRYRLFETPDDLPKFDEAVAPIRAELDALREANIRQFLSQFEGDGDGVRFDLLREVNGAPQTVEDVDPAQYPVEAGQDVKEVQRVWPGAEAAWQQYQEAHGNVRRRFHERKRLEKYAKGPVSDQQEHARLAVRQAELDHDVFLLTAAYDITSIRHELAALEKSRSDGKTAVARLAELYGEDATVTRFARRLCDALGKEVDDMSADPRGRLDAARAVIAQAPQPAQDAVAHYLEATEAAEAQTEEIQAEIESIKLENARHELRMVTAQGQEEPISVGTIVRAYPANQLGVAGRLGVYLSRWWEFVSDEPREANSEGGVFPAIWGTVLMTLIMSLAVVPFGVLGALYLREYAKAGPVVSAVRIAINNLAGVPSIVFGVFGLGFFCYIIGAFYDGGPANIGIQPMPSGAWWIVLLVLAAVGTGAFLTGLASLSSRTREKSRFQFALGYVSIALWLTSVIVLVVLIFWTPYFSGFHEPKLPNPTFGKGGLIWASLTLALLTLPVVIVATEEALSAVPNSLREGSYACGGSKWQTIKRIILPHAMPGIMTGMILAMARGAGEVAPLMLVGVAKKASELPLDTSFPYLHLDRSFLHLGFHIYDLALQSQNSEATKSLVFTTTLLLIGIIATLNVAAVLLRARLRKRFQGGEF
jgi:ABC-type phosphate transport system permease subunit/ABC-type phosphate transport system auxiliary subunit